MALPRRGDSRLAYWRKERRISQERLAHMTGLSTSTISRLERNEVDDPSLRALVNCALVLNVSLADICEPEWLQWQVLQDWAREPPVHARRRPLMG